MKNAIKYFYKLEPIEIHQINKKTKFSYSNKEYILYESEKKQLEINEIYKLTLIIMQFGIYCHKIIPNINKELVSTINNKNYILLETNIKTRNIDINDIMYYFRYNINVDQFKKIERENWHKLWTKKIDYIEYQISQLGNKYKLIRESSDYFIGIAEICISIISNMKNDETNMCISHNRVNNKTTTDDFYNPLNFIIDKRIRDLGEYIKNLQSIENKIEILKKIKNINILNNEEIILLFARIIFPSNYFDAYELILDNKIPEGDIIKILKKNKNYEEEIKKIYNYIRSISKIPEIEWLI